jgi:hypothetical protein
MRRIIYAGSWFYTGDAIAEAFVRYAAALARAETAGVIEFPGRDAAGDVQRLQVLIGPASQLFVENAEVEWPEVTSPEAVSRMARLTAALEAPIPGYQPPLLLDGE